MQLWNMLIVRRSVHPYFYTGIQKGLFMKLYFHAAYDIILPPALSKDAV